ncbi:MAG: PAS domain-containing protein [Anaerolineales bacterium]|nr:PAS domain-containing protein [Anaerolineales bacterium]
MFAKFTGYTMEEITALPIEAVLALIHPDDLTEVSPVIVESMSAPTGAPYQLEYRFRHKDGHYIWLQDRFTGRLRY